MKKCKNIAGYTVVELMIVTGISGLIAVSAFGLVAGEQAKNEFTNGVRDVETKLTTIAGAVSRGYYPRTASNPRCTAATGAITYPAAGSRDQGENAECIFAGKAIHFEPTNRTEMTVMTIASRRTVRPSVSGQPRPVLVSDISELRNGDMGSVSQLDETVSLSYGMRIKSVRTVGTARTILGGVVFLTDFGNRDSTTTMAGTPQTGLYSVNGGGLGRTLNETRARLANPSNYEAAPGDVTEICIEQGVGGRTALIVLGQSGRELTTTTRIESC